MNRYWAFPALTLLLVACGGTAPAGTPGPGGPGATATPTVAPTEIPTATPATPATPAVSTTPAATPEAACLPLQGGSSARAAITDVRVGAHTGFDRLVVEFDHAVPTWRMSANGSMTFTGGGRGEPMTLAGTYGVRLDISNVDWMHDVYAHGTDLVPLDSVLREVRVVGDFEGIVNLGIGLGQPACPTVTTLSGPPRLVVDFPTS